MIINLGLGNAIIDKAIARLQEFYPMDQVTHVGIGKHHKAYIIVNENIKEHDGKLPTRLTFLGHGSDVNVRVVPFGRKERSLNADELAELIIEFLQNCAKQEPNIKRSIDTIDLIACGIGASKNSPDNLSYAQTVALLINQKLPDDFNKPIRVLAFSSPKQLTEAQDIKVQSKFKNITIVNTKVIKETRSQQATQRNNYIEMMKSLTDDFMKTDLWSAISQIPENPESRWYKIVREMNIEIEKLGNAYKKVPENRLGLVFTIHKILREAIDSIHHHFGGNGSTTAEHLAVLLKSLEENVLYVSIKDTHSAFKGAEITGKNEIKNNVEKFPLTSLGNHPRAILESSPDFDMTDNLLKKKLIRDTFEDLPSAYDNTPTIIREIEDHIENARKAISDYRRNTDEKKNDNSLFSGKLGRERAIFYSKLLDQIDQTISNGFEAKLLSLIVIFSLYDCNKGKLREGGLQEKVYKNCGSTSIVEAQLNLEEMMQTILTGVGILDENQRFHMIDYVKNNAVKLLTNLEHKNDKKYALNQIEPLLEEIRSYIPAVVTAEKASIKPEIKPRF
jgi:hypothetical protein